MKTKKKKIDYNSTVNQDIKGRFVAREVLTCFSYEMEAILRGSQELPSNHNSDYPLPTYDDIENLYEYRCPDCGEGQETIEAFKDIEFDPNYICPDCSHIFKDEPESEPQEIYEWWIVTEYLYNKLKALGHPVLEWGNNCYWGRCTTGQAILLDYAISQICEGMEILDGQANSWAKK